MLLWLMRGTALVQGGVYDWGMHPMWVLGELGVSG